MKPKTAVASCVLTLLFLGCCATAQGQEALKRRLSVSYQGAPVTSVLQALATVIGARLQLDPRLSASVTVELRNVSAETILRAVCESVGCRWRLDQGRLIVEPDPVASSTSQADPYSDIKVSDVHQDIPAHIVWSAAPLDAVADTLARMLDAQLILDGTLSSKRVSLDQDRGSAWSAISSICRQAGCRWRFTSEVKRRLLLVADSPTSFDAVLPADVRRAGQPGVVAPKRVSDSKPRYTEGAKKAGLAGTVALECVVLRDGTVGQVRIVKSLDRVHGLDMEAVMAAKLSLFTPGTLDGTPVPVVAWIGVAFSAR
jgi:TonB family protein